jgi:hypothetical protein
MWTVPLVAARVFLGFMAANHAGRSLGSIDTGLVLGLAFVLAARFRDIGWPAWIGPAILLGTVLVVPLVVLGFAVANNAGDQMMEWLTLYGFASGIVNLVLLIVAGSMPGKPDVGAEAAQVFE